jgi:hypothetical protein
MFSLFKKEEFSPIYSGVFLVLVYFEKGILK